MHRLIEKDLVSKTGVCAICGPTRLVRIAKGGTCPQGHAETNTREYKMKDGSKIKLSGRERLEMIKKFGPDCMICGNEVGDSPQLDHCHDTGKFRGVLCRGCNTGIGLFQDDIERLKGAIAYLESHQLQVSEDIG